VTKPHEVAEPKMVDVFSDSDVDTDIVTNPAGYVIAELAEADPRIVTMTSDMGRVLADFRTRFPERYIEMGIAETNTISVAAGLATCGFRPYIYAMSSFGILKCAEQIRTDVAYNHLPVTVVGRLTGLALGFFGTSHHAVEDVAVARSLTNMVVIAPADSNAVLGLMRSTAELDGPRYIRVAEGAIPVYEEPPHIEFGRWPKLRSGADISLIGHGMGTGLAMAAAQRLEGQGVQADVYDAAFLKPHDESALLDTARCTGRVLTIEEHSEIGGLASIVAETLGRHGVVARLDRCALPDQDLEVGTPAQLHEFYGLTPEGVCGRAMKLLASS
jgi:transketolase